MEGRGRKKLFENKIEHFTKLIFFRGHKVYLHVLSCVSLVPKLIFDISPHKHFTYLPKIDFKTNLNVHRWPTHFHNENKIIFKSTQFNSATQIKIQQISKRVFANRAEA